MKKSQAIWFLIVTYKPEMQVLARLRKSLEGKHVIEIDNTNKNQGYGGGANEGIRKAIDQGAEWIVILNQDVVISNKTVDALCLRIAELPPCIAGPWTGSLDKKRWTTIFPSQAIDYISGACMAIHRQVIAAVGYFYTPYFMYYEDVDYCIRAESRGFALKKLAIRGISHANQPVWRRGSRRHELYLARNHLWFVWRLAPWRIKFYELLRLPKTMMELLLTIMKI